MILDHSQITATATAANNIKIIATFTPKGSLKETTTEFYVIGGSDAERHMGIHMEPDTDFSLSIIDAADAKSLTIMYEVFEA